MKFLRIFTEMAMSRMVLLAIALTAGYYFMYYDTGAAIEEQITSATQGVEGQKAKQGEIQKKMKKEEEMRGNLRQLARNLDLVKSKIPNEFNEIEVSSILNRASTATQVKIQALKRNGSGPLTGAAATKMGAELIEEVTFDIEMTGTFFGIISFVEFLSKEEKTIKVRNFTLEKNSASPTDEATIKFRGEIVGYKQALNPKAPGAK